MFVASMNDHTNSAIKCKFSSVPVFNPFNQRINKPARETFFTYFQITRKLSLNRSLLPTSAVFYRIALHLLWLLKNERIKETNVLRCWSDFSLQMNFPVHIFVKYRNIFRGQGRFSF